MSLPLLTFTFLGTPLGGFLGFYVTSYIIGNKTGLIPLMLKLMAIAFGMGSGMFTGFVLDYNRRANGKYPNDKMGVRMLDFADACTCGLIRFVFRLARQ